MSCSDRPTAVVVDVGKPAALLSVKESGEARPLAAIDATVGAAQPGVHR